MDLKDKILTIRNQQVMLDRDLAELYGVEVKYLKRQVRRNKKRFPEHFSFQLNNVEFKYWRRQNVTSNSDKMGLRYSPFAFTEQGVSMLSAVLKSNKAIEVSIEIMEAFVTMRKFLVQNATIFQKFQQFDQKILEYDKNFEEIFQAIRQKQLSPNKGIFFDGQIFDAYIFVSDIIKNAKGNIILIDNYIDTSVLTLLSKKKEKVKVIIYTKEISKQLLLDQDKFNQQYGNLTIKKFSKSHDRFLIIDKKTYHLGASLKDLGKKWFAFSVFNKESLRIIDKLQ